MAPDPPQLVALYFAQLIKGAASMEEATGSSYWGGRKAPPPIAIADDVTEDLLGAVAERTEGFSGRELAKLLAAVQAAVYGRADRSLDAALLLRVVGYKVEEHGKRLAFQRAQQQQGKSAGGAATEAVML